MTLHRYINVILTKSGIPCIVESHGLKFYCPSFTEMWRAETLLTKEPETIAWIDTFAPHSVLWDIGANVGTYTIYAAKKSHYVVSFEPSSRENEILKKNIELNLVWGMTLDWFLNATTDYSGLPLPNHIKIDTDGFECEIIEGLTPVLKQGTVKSMSVELDPQARDCIISMLEERGFVLVSENVAPMLIGTPYEKIGNGIFEWSRP